MSNARSRIESNKKVTEILREITLIESLYQRVRNQSAGLKLPDFNTFLDVRNPTLVVENTIQMFLVIKAGKI